MQSEADMAIDDDEEDNIEHIYLTFGVKGEQYAVGVRYVTEIVRLPEINPVPGMQRGFEGVINLRGNVVPILDMRARCGLEDLEPNDRTVIVVLDVDDERVGLMVEEVSEVVELPERDIQSSRAGQTGSWAKDSMVRGIARRGEKVSIVLDVEMLLTDEGPVNQENRPAV